jgi:hypothetical protein
MFADDGAILTGDSSTTGDGVASRTAAALDSAHRPAENMPPSSACAPIAIIGFAHRLPGRNNTPGQLWDFLQQGGVADNAVPPSRFRYDTRYDASQRPNTMKMPGGMFIEDVDPADFDASFFGVSRADACAMDPQHRQLMEVAYEALENAGLSMAKLDGADYGCFVASFTGGAFFPRAFSLTFYACAPICGVLHEADVFLARRLLRHAVS